MLPPLNPAAPEGPTGAPAAVLMAAADTPAAGRSTVALAILPWVSEEVIAGAVVAAGVVDGRV